MGQASGGGQRGVVWGAVALASCALAATSSANNLYVISDLNQPGPILAYDIRPAPEFLLPLGNCGPLPYGAVGLAADDATATLFVTIEEAGKLAWVDGKTGQVLGMMTTPGASNLAGIAVDPARRRIYAIERFTDKLFVYDWDPRARVPTFAGVVTLPGVGYGIGLAFDEATGWLFVTDLLTHSVRYFDTANWTLAGSFAVSQWPMGIAVDPRRRCVYTGNAFVHVGTPALLCRYDLTSGAERVFDLRACTGDPTDCVVGVAVDHDSGLVYITTGNEVWGGTDCIMVLTPDLACLYATGDIGNPTGLCVARSASNRPPVAEAGPDIVMEQTDHAGADVTLDGSASFDPEGAPLTYRWTWPGGAATGPRPTINLPHGATLVTLVVNDGSLDSPPDTLTVTVRDTTSPLLIAPADIAAEQATRHGTRVNLGQALTADICDAAPVLTNDAPDVFPLGTTIVTWTATDAAGNVATATQKVTVVDTTPPEVMSLSAAPSVLWPVNHEMIPITISVLLQDACDAAPSWRISRVTSNEPVTGKGAGNTAPDWQVTGDHTVSLRAERCGPNKGRIYTITIQATDASGNAALADLTVTVPHDQGKNPAK